MGAPPFPPHPPTTHLSSCYNNSLPYAILIPTWRWNVCFRRLHQLLFVVVLATWTVHLSHIWCFYTTYSNCENDLCVCVCAHVRKCLYMGVWVHIYVYLYTKEMSVTWTTDTYIHDHRKVACFVLTRAFLYEIWRRNVFDLVYYVQLKTT